MLRLLLLILWSVQAALVLLLVDAAWIERQIGAERDQLAMHLGEEQARQLLAQARAIFERGLVRTEMVERSYAALLPDPAAPTQGMENVAPWFFAWLKARLDTFWILALQVILRAVLLRQWLMVVILGVLAAMLDGYIQQRIKRDNNQLASADRYLMGRHAAVLGVMFPFFYVVVPVAAPIWLTPAWGLFMAITCRWLLTHAQHRL